MSAARIRRDPYHGWRFYWQGCPDPFKRSRFMYRAQREKGWNRRISAAVALWVVWGRFPAFRYASDRGYLPSRRPNEAAS